MNLHSFHYEFKDSGMVYDDGADLEYEELGWELEKADRDCEGD